ncbi:MAG: L-threonine 3-dehydrogenase [Parachlamydiales bacterium]|jgi:threonine 3-dehydrogenase
MKAIVKKEAKEGLWLSDVPVPTLGKNDVLIKPIKTAICGTDINIYKWSPWAQKNVPVPLVIGHEFVGTITEVGSDVKHLKPGMRVTGEGHLTCGHCTGCRHGKRHLCSNVRGLGYHSPGCFAEYFTMPQENVFPLPESIPDDIAAIFDPFGNSVHTAFSLELPANNILIAGSGPIGMMATAIAKHAGARRIIVTDVNASRLEIAKQMGATDIVDVTKQKLSHYLKEIGLEEGVSGSMEMSGHPDGLKQLLENTRYGGTVALLGILPPNTVIDWDLVIFKMLILKGIYGREIFATWDYMVNLIESGLDLKPIITHRFHYTDFNEAFQTMTSGKSGKIILDWSV